MKNPTPKPLRCCVKTWLSENKQSVHDIVFLDGYADIGKTMLTVWNPLTEHSNGSIDFYRRSRNATPEIAQKLLGIYEQVFAVKLKLLRTMRVKS